MLMLNWFHRLSVAVATVLVTGASASAQTVPALDTFSGRTFEGTVYASWPVVFDGCTFITDSVVLNHSYGTVFRNCSIESRTGVLYMAESGDGIILADCEVTGCRELMFSRTPSLSDRNYITGVKLNGEECSVLDDQENIIDIDGLDLSESVRGTSKGPLLLMMNSDKGILKGGETAVVRISGLERGMFVGWQISAPKAMLYIVDEFTCLVTAPELIEEDGTIVISAYTEYGLEAACEIVLMAEEKASRKRKK